jgi:hypothetical protein
MQANFRDLQECHVLCDVCYTSPPNQHNQTPLPYVEYDAHLQPGIFHRAERVTTFRNRNLRMPDNADLSGELKASAPAFPLCLFSKAYVCVRVHFLLDLPLRHDFKPDALMAESFMAPSFPMHPPFPPSPPLLSFSPMQAKYDDGVLTITIPKKTPAAVGQGRKAVAIE